MPVLGSGQKFGTTKRLDEVAATTERATSWAVTPLSPRALAVDLDADGRIVERLAVLEVAQRRDLRQLGRGASRRRRGRRRGSAR